MAKIYSMSKEVALKYAKPFCEENGYDFEMLKSIRYDGNKNSDGIGAFCLAPLHSGEGGLTVDMLSMPRPVLAVYQDGTVEPFPYIEELRIKK